MRTARRLALVATLLGLCACSSSAALPPIADDASADAADAAPDASDADDSGFDAAVCVGKTSGDACGACVESACCPELSLCLQIPRCVACIGGDFLACGDVQALSAALGACQDQHCAAPCGSTAALDPTCDVPVNAPSQGACVATGGAIACNPLTNAGCDAAKGQTCDFSGTGSVKCYPSGAVHAICEGCGASGDFCAVGLTCAQGKCARVCCTDADCGAGRCDRSTAVTAGSGAGVCLRR